MSTAYDAPIIYVYEPDFTPKDYAALEKPTLKYDYLVLGATQIEVPKELDCAEADYIKIDEFDGIIKGVDIQDGRTILSVMPLMSLINITTYYPRENIYTVSLEQFFKNMIEREFVATADTVQRVPGLNVRALTKNIEGRLNLVDDVHNIYELAVKALIKYRMVINFKLNPQQKTIVCEIYENTAAARFIKTDLDNIIAKNIKIQGEAETCNKFTAVDRAGYERPITIYANDYAAPSKPVTEYIGSENKELFKVDTQYKQIYVPRKPYKPSDKTHCAFYFDGGTGFGADNTESELFGSPCLFVVLNEVGINGLYVYFWEGREEGWYDYGAPEITKIDYSDLPNFIIEKKITDATNIENVSLFFSDKPSEFYAKAAERAEALFAKPEFNNLIELTVHNTDKLVNDFKIGQIADIIVKNNIYPSVLTGYEIMGETIKYVFGAVRMELTKKLKIEKRGR